MTKDQLSLNNHQQAMTALLTGVVMVLVVCHSPKVGTIKREQRRYITITLHHLTLLYITLHHFKSLYISLYYFTSLYISLHYFTSLYIT